MNNALRYFDGALVARGENLDLTRLQSGRKPRTSVELGFDEFAVIVKRLVRFRVQVDGKLGRERKRGG